MKEVKEPFLPCSHFTLPSGAVVHVGHSGLINGITRSVFVASQDHIESLQNYFPVFARIELIFCNPEAFWEYIC